MDLTGPKFGNMTEGNGLSAIFDGLISTIGYASSTIGWAGVTLPTPKAINYAEFVSASNGFDASGLEGSASTVTLQLRGANGPTPTSPYAGTLLAQQTFMDENVLRPVGLLPSNNYEEFKHVWAVVQTPVWSILTELRLFETPAPIVPLIEESATLINHCDIMLPLSQAGQEVSLFRVQFQTNEPRNVDVDFNFDAAHIAKAPWLATAVGNGGIVLYRSAPTLAGMMTASWQELYGARGGFNISERNPQHYGSTAKFGSIALPAGFHQFSIHISGHTDATPLDALAAILVESGKPMNGLRVVVHPIEHQLIRF